MNSDFEKDFETILEECLADTRNLFPGVDVSKGSPHFVMAARLAAATWGLHKKQANIVKQIFVDTSTSLLVDRHAFCVGLTRAAGESTESLATRVLAKRRTPNAGGNEDDYVEWANEVDGVAGAHCIPVPLGPGTVAVVVLAEEGYVAEGETDTVPSQALLDAVELHIDEVRSVTAGDFSVLAVQALREDIAITVTGSVNNDALSASIRDYCLGLNPKNTLVLSQLAGLALELGAIDAEVTVPAANVIATDYQVIRAGEITIS